MPLEPVTILKMTNPATFQREKAEIRYCYSWEEWLRGREAETKRPRKETISQSLGAPWNSNSDTIAWTLSRRSQALQIKFMTAVLRSRPDNMKSLSAKKKKVNYINLILLTTSGQQLTSEPTIEKFSLGVFPIHAFTARSHHSLSRSHTHSPRIGCRIRGDQAWLLPWKWIRGYRSWEWHGGCVSMVMWPLTTQARFIMETETSQWSVRVRVYLTVRGSERSQFLK